MNARLKQLRDLVVALDLADRKLQPIDADAYQAAARKALRLTHDEMGLLPISDFAGPPNALQTMAENIFFGFHRCFADLDGSGRARAAVAGSLALFERFRAVSEASGREVADSLFARLRAGPVPATVAARRRTPRRRRNAASRA
jgi:hypothetical protein